MTIIERLSSSLGDRDNVADIALAEEIASTGDRDAILELVEHLNAKNRRLQSDCIKTLYEIGERRPELIVAYTDEFAPLLTSKNPRLVWGTMCALDACASANAEAVYPHLDAILEAARGESVIARDHAVGILVKLCQAKHAKKCFPILLDIIRTAPLNQLPSYCEKTAEAATGAQREELAKLVRMRLPEVADQKAKKARMEKVLKRLG